MEDYTKGQREREKRITRMSPKLIYKCQNCHKYTLESQKCPSCGNRVHIVHPAPVSLTDKWGKWRRRAKERIEKEK